MTCGVAGKAKDKLHVRILSDLLHALFIGQAKPLLDEQWRPAPKQRVDPAELRQVVGVLPTSDDGLMAAACRGDGAEAGQAIGEHCASRSQVLPGPGADRLGTEPGHRSDFGVNRMTGLVEGNGCNDGNLVL